jgi:uncharacterized membrane protein YadS
MERNLAKKMGNSAQMQTIMHVVGFVGMLTCFLLILTLLIPDRSTKDDQTGAYVYLLTVPMFFIIFLAIFLLPSFWYGKGIITKTINNFLGYSKWWHLDRIAMTFYIVGPLVIGFSVFSMQSSIYYDADTLITYLLGDLTMIYIISLVVTAAIENQISMLSEWVQ